MPSSGSGDLERLIAAALAPSTTNNGQSGQTVFVPHIERLGQIVASQQRGILQPPNCYATASVVGTAVSGTATSLTASGTPFSGFTANLDHIEFLTGQNAGLTALITSITGGGATVNFPAPAGGGVIAKHDIWMIISPNVVAAAIYGEAVYNLHDELLCRGLAGVPS